MRTHSHVSASELRTMVCDRQHRWAYLDRFTPAEQKPWTAEGVACHSVMQSLLLGEPDPSRHLAELPDDRQEHLANLIADFVASDEWETILRHNIVGVEHEAFIPLPGTDYRLKVVIDALLVDPQTEVGFPLDWKFQSAFASSLDALWRNEQANAYLYAVKYLAGPFGFTPGNTMQFVFLRRNTIREPRWQIAHTARTGAELQAFAARASAEAERQKTDTPRHGDWCDLCDFVEPCKLESMGLHMDAAKLLADPNMYVVRRSKQSSSI